MTEVPKGQRFVGSADATREAGKPAEFPLSPEQQQVADMMKESGEKLEKTVVDARMKAGEKLKELQGKELAKAGFKQTLIGMFGGGMLEGIGGGVVGLLVSSKLQAKHSSIISPENVTPMDILLAQAGEKLGEVGEEEIHKEALNMLFQESMDKQTQFADAVIKDVQPYAMVGKAVGMELSGLAYTKLARNRNLPPLRWYDWACGHVGLIPLTKKIHGFPVNFNPINIVTFGGLRNMATGLWQMARGQ